MSIERLREFNRLDDAIVFFHEFERKGMQNFYAITRGKPVPHELPCSTRDLLNESVAIWGNQWISRERELRPAYMITRNW